MIVNLLFHQLYTFKCYFLERIVEYRVVHPVYCQKYCETHIIHTDSYGDSICMINLNRINKIN